MDVETAARRPDSAQLIAPARELVKSFVRSIFLFSYFNVKELQGEIVMANS